MFALYILILCGTAVAIEVFLPGGDAGIWKYHDRGVLEGNDWRRAQFDDKSWKSGTAPLGYGDEGMSTTVSFGDNARRKHVTTYFRRGFEWKAAGGEGARLQVLLRCDDGGVVYLNGAEIARQNMPEGEIIGKTLADFAISGDEETRFNSFIVPLEGRLKAGLNMAAVEIHQANRSSSDLGFDLQMNLYMKGEVPNVDHYAEGMAAFRRNDSEAGVRHFSAITPGDPDYESALQALVENILAPEGLNQPDMAVAFATKGYEATPDDMEVVRAYIRSHVIAGKNLTYPLQKRPAPVVVPQEFRFIQQGTPNSGRVSRKLNQNRLREDLDYLELMIDNCYSYAERRGVDWKTALDVVRVSLGDKGGVTVAELAFRLERFLTLFGDPHTSLRVSPSLYLSGGFAPFIAQRDGERVFLVNPGRTAFIDPRRPYLKAIDGKPVARWLEAASRRVSRASPQYQGRQLGEELSHIVWLRTELGLAKSDTVTLGLVNSEGKDDAVIKLKIRERSPRSGKWPEGESRLLKDIGYLRIPSMSSSPGFINSLNEWMVRFKDTQGLVIDVRGNGGGTQDCLKTLLPYFVERDAPLRVVNVAAYRMPIKLPRPNPSGFLGLYGRGLHPVTSNVWQEDERAAIRRFLSTFDTKWKLPKGKFSDWHAMGIRSSTNPKAYHYVKPVIVLSDSGCFSATDNFLGGFKGVAGVTLMGSTSGGGSGRMQSYKLPNSGIPLTLCQMASFQRNGYTYDGHGVEPDVRISPKPEDALKDHGDSVLEAALKRLRG